MDPANVRTALALAGGSRCAEVDYGPVLDLDYGVGAVWWTAVALTRTGRASIGECRPTTAAHCRNSTICATKGDCTLSAPYGYCSVGSDADCEASALCRNEGKCKDHGTCVADSEAKCRASTRCRTHGLCSLGYTMKCEAKNNADCQGSSRCQSNGECTARKGRCVTGS